MRDRLQRLFRKLSEQYIRGSSVRFRITLWQTGILAIVLITGAVVAYGVFRRSTYTQIDQSLATTAISFQQGINTERNEDLSARPDETVRHELIEFTFHDMSIVVYDANHHIVGISLARDLLPRVQHGVPPLPLHPIHNTVIHSIQQNSPLRTVTDGDDEFRIYSGSITVGSRPYWIVVVQAMHDEREAFVRIVESLLIVIPFVVICAGIAGSFLVQRSLAPVATMTEHAARIGSGDIAERLPIANPHDELGRLATVFNDLLARLNAALDRQRQFMADASHELRTPVAIVRAEVDVTLAQPHREEQEYRDTINTIGTAAKRLSGVVGNLFLLARADAGEHPIIRGPGYLGDIVSDSAQGLRSLAARRNMSLLVSTPEDGAPYDGDAELLSRLVTNLVENAVKYGAADTDVVVSLRAADGVYLLDVTSHGPTIPPDQHERIFDRFVQTGLPGPDGGAGLGLPIARWIAESHGGSLVLLSSEQGTTVFGCTLPITIPTVSNWRKTAIS